MKIDLGKYSKAIGVAILGAVKWGDDVVGSTSKQITAKEWMALVGFAGLTVVTYVLKNTGEDNG